MLSKNKLPESKFSTTLSIFSSINDRLQGTI
jgi:hypothetical protein